MSRTRARLTVVVAGLLAGGVAWFVLSPGAQVPRRATRGDASEARGEGAGSSEARADGDATSSPGLTGGLLVRLVREDRGSADGARVVLLTPDECPEVVTGSAGEARFPARPSSGIAIASLDGFPLAAACLEGSGPEVTIHFREGGVIGGRVILAGGALPKRLQLDCPESAPPEEVLPGDLYTIVAAFGLKPDSQVASVDADGRFRFRGLPVGAAAEISAHSRDYASDLQNAPPTMRVLVPDEDVVFRLCAYARVSGRVVRADGTPVVRAALVINTSSGYGMSGTTDESGAFSESLREFEGRGLKVTVANEQGLGSRMIDVGDFGPEGVALGDIAVAAGEATRALLLVLDDQGQPLADAYAMAYGYGAKPVGPPDSKGLITLPSVGEKYRIAAWGYAVAELDVSATPPAAPLEVRLARVAILRLAVVGAPEGTFVLVRSNEDLFDPLQVPERADRLLVAAGFGVKRLVWSAADRWVWSAADGERRQFRSEVGAGISLLGPKPGVTFQVALTDALGVAQSEQAVRLEPREERTVTLVAERLFRTIEGVVRDEEGEAVPDADVQLAAVGKTRADRIAGGRTDETGRFAIPGISAAEAQAYVDAEGFELWVRESVRLDAGALAIGLARGRTLVVRVVDDAGKPVEGATVEIYARPALRWNGFPVSRGVIEIEPGTYEARGVARTDALVDISKGDRQVIPTATLEEREIRVVLPR